MKLYWNVNSIPEFSKISPSDKKRVWKVCVRQTLKKWQWHLGALIVLGSLIVIGEHLGDALGGAIGAGLGALILNHLTIKYTRPVIQRYLKESK